MGMDFFGKDKEEKTKGKKARFWVVTKVFSNFAAQCILVNKKLV